MKPTEEQINSIQFDPADPEKSFRQLQELMTRKPDETPTAPATPALSPSKTIGEALERIFTLTGFAIKPGWDLFDWDVPGRLDEVRERISELYARSPKASRTPSISKLRQEIERLKDAPSDVRQFRKSKLCDSLLSIADMLEKRAVESETWFKDELSKLEHIRVENEKLKKQMEQAIRGLRHYTMWTHLGTDTAKSALRSIAQMEEGKA